MSIGKLTFVQASNKASANWLNETGSLLAYITERWVGCAGFRLRLNSGSQCMSPCSLHSCIHL